jgi:uncharacterized protein (DUF4415 family)
MNKPALTDENGAVRDRPANDFLQPLAEDDPALAEAMRKRRGGRPKVETPKVHVGFRMAADLVDGIKATGKGYNARVETVLRDALAKGLLDPQPAAQSDLWDSGS